MLKILVVGLSYKTAPVEVREKISFSQAILSSEMQKLSDYLNINECCIISTCNRVEIYAVGEDYKDCEKDIISFLSLHSNFSEDNIKEYLYCYTGSDAIKHLFRVASGMESMVVGEPQILGQVKDFFKHALVGKYSGLILNRLFHSTFFVAKKIRTETKISSEAISISYLAVELAKRIFEDLKKRSVMLVGTGDMSELAAKHLVSQGIDKLFITSRDFRNAQALSEQLSGSAFKMEELFYYLKKVDIVITATGSSDYIIKADDIVQSLKLRKNEPMFIIDIAVPRDVDPKINDISGVYLYDIDDLKGVSEENLKSRKKSIEAAEHLVVEAEKSFTNWMQSIKVFPTIVDLKNRLEKIKESELNKALNKLDDLEAKEKSVIEKLASSIVGKILHEPVTKLKRESSSYNGMLYSEVLKTLFELDENKISIELLDDEAHDRN